jgi:hypothetical protein
VVRRHTYKVEPREWLLPVESFRKLVTCASAGAILVTSLVTRPKQEVATGSKAQQSQVLGGVAEWSKAAVLKTAELARVPGVRIPSPPLNLQGIQQRFRGRSLRPPRSAVVPTEDQNDRVGTLLLASYWQARGLRETAHRCHEQQTNARWA